MLHRASIAYNFNYKDQKQPFPLAWEADWFLQLIGRMIDCGVSITS